MDSNIGHSIINTPYDVGLLRSVTKPLQDVLVVGALVDVLEPSPTAHVIDEERREVGSLGLDISHELVETLPAGDVQPTTAMVGIFVNDLHVVVRCVLADDIELVFRRILLILGRHADVPSRARWRPRGHRC